MMELLKGLSLEEKQRRFYNGSHCPYCGQETQFIDSIKVYQESHGMIHFCEPCQAWCGTIPRSDQSIGMIGRKPLRSLRIEAHKYYDPLIQAKINQHGTKRLQAQAEGRKWMGELLGLDVLECHIGYMDEDNCRILIEKCKSLYPTEEQIKRKQSDIQYRIDVVHFKASELGFEFKEFLIMGKVQMELKHFNGKVFYFDPVKKSGRWQNKKKPSPIEDIEEFINANFQPV